MSLSHPKPGTGIKQSLLQNYAFEDQAWTDSLHPDHAKFTHLARHCVLVGDGVYILDKHTQAWVPVGRAGALAKLLSERGGMIALGNQFAVITKDDIKTFLAQGVVSFVGVTYAPGAADFVIFQDQKRLNLYRDRRLAGETNDMAATMEFLKVIRNSLCAEADEVGFDEMLAEIHGAKPTLFRWVLHWLAARYQRPGYAPQTNLWFIGPLRGVGKGTLVSAMSVILGSRSVGKANQLDVAKGWTDSLFGKECIEWDEFKAPGGWIDTSNLIKAMTGNETIQINTRNVGGTTHPAVAMHIFSTNDEKPMRVEEWDRQNTFVATTGDPAWAARAKALWDEESREFRESRTVSGFAALLNEIEVDYRFICRPFLTKKREELLDAFGCSVRRWFLGADLEALRGATRSIEDLHSTYRDWVREHLHSKPEDIEEFRRKMLGGGWMVARSTTTGSRSDNSRRSVRGFRLCLPDLTDGDELQDRDEPFSTNVIVLPSSTSVIVRDTDIENVVTTAVEFPVAHTLMKNIMTAKHDRVG